MTYVTDEMIIRLCQWGQENGVVLSEQEARAGIEAALSAPSVGETDETELKPCPWCDKHPSSARLNDRRWRVICVNTKTCPARPYVDRNTQADAEAGWNTRASSPELERMREALHRLTNSADGLSFREAEIREVIGNTNWAVLRDHIKEARSVLALSEGGR